MGISILAATLEQKVWTPTRRPVFPNLYVFLVGHPGTGKTKTIWEARDLLAKLPEFHIAPTSLTFAKLVDRLALAKRIITRQPEGEMKYNSMTILADELGAFMHKYDTEMYKGLSAFYDPMPYGHERRTGDIKVTIESPQLNLLCGTTPTDLMKMMPDEAWGQGFSARLLMIFSDERIRGDDFAPRVDTKLDDLTHDLEVINSMCIGEFTVTPEYVKRVKDWTDILGEAPIPNHPRLIHYNTRRRVHLYKLSMISAVDRSNELTLTGADFDRAFNWLCNAEVHMPDIFKAGVTGADGQAIDDIIHYIRTADKGPGVADHKIIHFARRQIPLSSILRVIEVMERSGQIRQVSIEPLTGIRYYKATPHDPLGGGGDIALQ